MVDLASELTLNQSQELIARLGRFGFTLERVLEVLGNDETLATWIKAYPTKGKFNVEMSAFKVMVDGTLDLQAMIAAGKYGLVSEMITAARFPITNKGKRESELLLVHLDRNLTTEEVVAELSKRGLRPATIEELLAFGAAQPELQRELPIVALGSRCVLDDSEYVPVLYIDLGCSRGLYLVYSHKWDYSYQFLAVRK